MTSAATAAAIAAKIAQRKYILSEIEWLIDNGANRFDLERAIPSASIASMERLAYRDGNKTLAQRIHRLLAESNAAAA